MPKITTVFLLTIFAQQYAYALESINELEWNSRVILVRTTSEPAGILNDLKFFEQEIQDRHIDWFIFFDSKIKTNYQGDLHEKLYSNTANQYFVDIKTNVVLIGKDGTIKQRREQLDLQSIFELIDMMPMRQLEMKNVDTEQLGR